MKSLSVVMSVYNGETFLEEAVASILSQSYDDFEFIIIDDGSTDKTPQILKKYPDKRLKILTHKNQGLASSLNRGIREASSTYVARMDADDISLPTRLEYQMTYLNKHPHISLLGAAVEAIDTKGNHLKDILVPLRDIDLRRAAYFGNPFNHGSVIFKKADCLSVGGYDDKVGPVEDYDLWMKIMKNYQIANLPDVLYKWRINPSGVTQSQAREQQICAMRLQQRLWSSRQFPSQTLAEATEGKRYYIEQAPTHLKRYTEDQWRIVLLVLRHMWIMQTLKTLICFVALGKESWVVLSEACVRQFRQSLYASKALIKGAVR